MPTITALLAATLAAAAPARAGRPAPDQPAGGPVREIRTAEGFLRLEGPGAIEPGQGSFSTYPAPRPALRAAAPAGPSPAELAPPPSTPPTSTPPPVPADPCRPERDRYLRRLLRLAGIDVEHPADLFDGLASGPGAPVPAVVAGWLAQVDPVRPLAWDADLRAAGGDLAACQAGAGER